MTQAIPIIDILKQLGTKADSEHFILLMARYHFLQVT